MELAELKDRIEKYFKEVDPDELYELALSCGFKQVEEETEGDKSSLQQSKREPIVLPTTLIVLLLRTKNWCLKNSYIS